MNFELNNKLNYMYEGIKILNGFCDFDWCGRLLYPYYLHFNDENHKYRDGSLLAFYGLLKEWQDQSGFPFFQGEYEDSRHHFEHYINAFIKHTPLIKINYPNLYKMIIHILSALDSRDHFEEMFPFIDIQLINTLRQQLQKDKIEFTKLELRLTHKNAFKEIGIDLNQFNYGAG